MRALLRSVAVLLACLGLAAATLASTAGGGAADPGPAVVKAALSHVGDTYVWGGTGPTSWDCSGFTSTLWREVGGAKDVPRTARQQQAWAVPIPAEQALPGDLVFFGDPVTHVGLVDGRTTTQGRTTVTMVDASSTQKGVVRRAVWTAGTVRFGRVPRKGMTPVTPWKAPTPPAKPAPTARPTPAAAPSTPPSTPPSARPALVGLPTRDLAPSSPVAAKAVRLARAAVGSTTYTDVGLVTDVWRRAGGTALKAGTTRTALTKAARPVALRDARVGDLVVYAAPADHVGVYVGGGLMVDASRSLGKVVLRPVWSAPGVQVVRLPA